MTAPRAAAASRSFGLTMTQLASEAASCGSNLGLARNDSVPGVAPSSGPRRSIPIDASPTSSPPSAATMSPRSATMLGAAGLLAALRVERLDHLVGDVDLRAGKDGFLHDQVVLLAV